MTTNQKPDLVTEARELLAKATQPPWHWAPADPERCFDVLDYATGDDALWGVNGVRILTDGSARGEYNANIDVIGPDAALIARAPELLRQLADEVERLRTVVGYGASGKLTPESVSEIKAGLRVGASQGFLAERFGVTETTISNIKTGRTWRHVK